ncbi:MAG: ABC transporter substrate-binding protein [Christensenellales bacterium]|jgi:peptide/nickel transport system substrate-binding protein
MQYTKGSTTISKKILCLVLALLSAAIMVGCNIDSLPGATETPPITAIPSESISMPTDGHLKVSMPLRPDSLNPLDAVTAEMVSLLSLVYETPIKLGANGELSPSLFTKWEKQPDGSYLFSLREEVAWHNGTVLSADDIIYTLEQIQQRATEGTPCIYTECLSQIQSYEKTQDGALRILPKNGLVLLLYTLNFPVLPQGDSAGSLPVGTGPYRVTSYTPEASMELSFHQEWWHSTPSITQISALCMKDSSAASSAFENGDIHLLYADEINAATYKQGGVNTLREVPTLYYDYLALNFSHPNLANKTIRQALAYSLDKTALITRAYSNHAVAADWPMLPGSYLSDIRYTYTPANSKEIHSLLASAGYEDRNQDGILENASMQPLSFSILVQSDVLNTSMTDMADAIQRQLEHTGFDITIEAVSYSDYTGRLNARDFDLALVSTYRSNTPDLSPFLASGGPLNFGSYFDTEMSALLRAASAADESDFQGAMQSVQKKFVQDLPHISLCFKTRSLLHHQSLQGINELLDPTIFNEIHTWYILDN